MEETLGYWEPVKYRFEHLPVHISLLHTGKVLAFGGTGNDETNPHPFPAELFDPQKGSIKSINQVLDGDIFCSGHTFLADGRLLVAGGTYHYDRKLFGVPLFPPFTGIEQSYTFDPLTERWSREETMSNGRWYPTLIMLADGTILTVAGLTKGFPYAFLRDLEVFRPDLGWLSLKGAEHWFPLYPRLHLLPNGEIFYTGSYNTHLTFPFSLKSFPTALLNTATREWRTIGSPKKSEREEGTSVLLPLLPPDYNTTVLLAGGGTIGGETATNTAEIIELSTDYPTWEGISPMHYARYYTYAVILPDQNILVLGGRGALKGHGHHTGDDHCRDGDVEHDENAVLDPELFDPKAREWRLLASMTVDRLYHAGALLLPDGRVMTAGSNPERRCNELRIEIYHPPYLFKGPRPVISEAPERIFYDTEFTIHTKHAEDIEAICLIRPSSTTHCVNTDQRYVGLEFQRRTNKLTAIAPPKPTIAPPGYYMLFILKKGGIPSVAPFIHLS